MRGGYDFLDASLMQAGDHAPRPAPHIAAAAARALARAGVLRATSVRVRHCAHAYALVLTVASTAAKAAAAAASAVFSASPSAAANAVFGGGGGGGGGEGGVANSQATRERGESSGVPGEGAGKDWKLVYSGDCRPSEPLVREGKGAAVLIHEATFDETKQQVRSIVLRYRILLYMVELLVGVFRCACSWVVLAAMVVVIGVMRMFFVECRCPRGGKRDRARSSTPSSWDNNVFLTLPYSTPENLERPESEVPTRSL